MGDISTNNWLFAKVLYFFAEEPGLVLQLGFVDFFFWHWSFESLLDDDDLAFLQSVGLLEDFLSEDADFFASHRLLMGLHFESPFGIFSDLQSGFLSLVHGDFDFFVSHRFLIGLHFDSDLSPDARESFDFLHGSLAVEQEDFESLFLQKPS